MAPRTPSSVLRASILVVAVALVLWWVPRRLAGWDADSWFDGDVDTQDALARTVAAAVMAQTAPTAYHSGEVRFDGQATIAIHQMALLGLGQLVLEHPERRDAYLPAMRAAAARLADPATLEYAATTYGQHGVVSMAPGEGHAYLGYVNLGLGMLRLLEPDMPLAGLHDRLTAQLADRLDASPTGLIETYPGESWAPDVAAVAGSVGLHARATGVDRGALLERWAARFEACVLHESGMAYQQTQSGTCAPVDAPRGSGTAVAAYFLSFAAPALAKKLYAGLVENAWTSVDGFGGVREYARGFDGEGDVDAGPIVFGVSVGATGFGLGAARSQGDRAHFTELYRSTSLLGVPITRSGRTQFAPGGALGNALLLAMLTTRRP